MAGSPTSLSTTTIYSHAIGQPVLSGTPSYKLDEFVTAEFYWPHSVADDT